MQNQKALVAVCAVALMLGAAGIGFAGIRAGATSTSATTNSRPPAKKMMAIGMGQLCVTEGAIDKGRGEEMTIDVPKMRAFVTEETAEAAEAHFTYVGETAKTSALGSGEIRHQFGLKLRAQDACNLVYAMWRFSPKNEVVVSVKSNPGMQESSQCGNRGYTNIKASFHSPVPEVREGSKHILHAELNGEKMTVTADSKVVWEGSVDPAALAFHGPVGIRSDNVHIELKLFAEQSSAKKALTIPACKAYAE
ncbi:MAG: hypothetical protein JO119_18280 [Acidobacteria bacterium]|nr:hypothetical protein [Acidobacteriota bacterium]